MTAKATVYVSSTCPYCTMMTNYLEEIHVPYETINITTDSAAGQRLVETTGQMGVPQTLLNGKWILGFDPASVQAALDA
ncbi:NrdH-redoxin [Sporosarcina sp. P37]|uniref:glutaredoxin family protein n=1 Tax=unclassified Sporosarcina TaxID=2647733 RepID=UPI0009C1A5C9|nr:MULTISPECIES: glutaredoxin domain-containing protein [unclassified Sporosarcina]ARD47454.1 NrdH-redoxin [Sporosarcina sp. P33]ARK24024.1 NrdH-redoxin [Sporosarcina sp. P37]PID18586.1 NrdH-redoxin [Sporosarcina sp. P35]